MGSYERRSLGQPAGFPMIRRLGSYVLEALVNVVRLERGVRAPAVETNPRTIGLPSLLANPVQEAGAEVGASGRTRGDQFGHVESVIEVVLRMPKISVGVGQGYGSDEPSGGGWSTTQVRPCSMSARHLASAVGRVAGSRHWSTPAMGEPSFGLDTERHQVGGVGEARLADAQWSHQNVTSASITVRSPGHKVNMHLTGRPLESNPTRTNSKSVVPSTRCSSSRSWPSGIRAEKRSRPVR